MLRALTADQSDGDFLARVGLQIGVDPAFDVAPDTHIHQFSIAQCGCQDVAALISGCLSAAGRQDDRGKQQKRCNFP